MNKDNLKKCPFCGKEIQRLDMHIINHHPKIIEQLEEYTGDKPIKTGNLSQNPGVFDQNMRLNPPVSDINSMIREKLDTMLNIKIIEMLSKSPDTSLQSISQALNPPQPLPLEQLKAYHDLVYPKQEKQIEIPETGNEWVDLATAAIPLIRDMLPNRKTEEVKQNEHRSHETGNLRTLKPISDKIARDPGKPTSIGSKPGTPGDTEQPNYSVIDGINPGA